MTTRPVTPITRLGAELPGWRDRLAQQAGLTECPDHKGQPPTECPLCAVEAHHRELADRQREVANDATARCDRLIPKRYVNAYADHEAVSTWAHAYAQQPDDAPSLLILGPTGTGKTWQAYGALRRAVTVPRAHRGVGYRCDDWEAATYADILASMRPGSSADPEAALTRLTTVPLLLIDDLGLSKQSEWVEDVTYRLINSRYQEMRPSIFTSNLAVDQLRAALGDRVASRLAETCTRVALTGADRRRTPTPIGAAQ